MAGTRAPEKNDFVTDSRLILDGNNGTFIRRHSVACMAGRAGDAMTSANTLFTQSNASFCFHVSFSPLEKCFVCRKWMGVPFPPIHPPTDGTEQKYLHINFNWLIISFRSLHHLGPSAKVHRVCRTWRTATSRKCGDDSRHISWGGVHTFFVLPCVGSTWQSADLFV